jgi:hypothetical protein
LTLRSISAPAREVVGVGSFPSEISPKAVSTL